MAKRKHKKKCAHGKLKHPIGRRHCKRAPRGRARHRRKHGHRRPARRRAYRNTPKRQRLARARAQCKGEGSRAAFWNCVRTEMQIPNYALSGHRRHKRQRR